MKTGRSVCYSFKYRKGRNDFTFTKIVFSFRFSFYILKSFTEFFLTNGKRKTNLLGKRNPNSTEIENLFTKIVISRARKFITKIVVFAF